MKKLMRMVFDAKAIEEMMRSEIEKESGADVATSVDFQNPLNIVKLSEIFKQGMVENVKKNNKGFDVFVKQGMPSVGDLEMILVGDNVDDNEEKKDFNEMMEMMEVVILSKEGTKQYQKDYNEAIASFERIN